MNLTTHSPINNPNLKSYFFNPGAPYAPLYAEIEELSDGSFRARVFGTPLNYCKYWRHGETAKEAVRQVWRRLHLQAYDFQVEFFRKLTQEVSHMTQEISH